MSTTRGVTRLDFTEVHMSTPPTSKHGARNIDSVYLGRRLLLALGGAALVSGCTSDQVGTRGGNSSAGAGQAGSDLSTLPGDSRPAEPGDTASSPATASPGQPATVAKPVPDVCPPVSGVKEKLGGPQHYLPCHGTNIALTIDDGPDPTYTPLMLALLSRYNISATFCVIGVRAAANPTLVARVAGAGHQIANHTYTHPLNLPGLTPAQIRDQISRTSDTLSGLTAGARPTLFRAPGGNWSPTVLAACKTAGLRPLDWSVDPRDWSQPGVQHITQVILTNTRPGAIILNHDGGGNRQQTLDALGIALPRLIDAGYTFTQP